MVYTEDIINKYRLFWQYPAITEKQFYLQEKDNAHYFGLPWATINDKRYNHSLVFNIVKHLVNKDHKYYTCCQHISYKMFIPLWKALNITKVYISHKQIGIDNIDGIELLPCPLFAVNFETKEYNKDFENVDFINVERPMLYSFIGGYQPRDYMSNIRQRIFDMKHPDNTDIINTGIWHLDNIVFSNKQNYSGEINKPIDFDSKTSYYNEMLIKSKFTLCPSGSGPNSIRFWEALACGSIPILLSDTLQLPYHELWDKAIVRIQENKLHLLNDTINKITEEEITDMRINCMKIYKDFQNQYKKSIFLKINIPINYIKPYYNVFGHFFLDHLLILFKIYNWYISNDYDICGIIIVNLDKLVEVSQFALPMYKSIFKNVLSASSNFSYKYIDVGIVLGSPINSESKAIYLARTSTNINIPLNILTNSRKLNELNKNAINRLANNILETYKNDTNFNNESNKEVLIINRNSKTRQLLNLEKFIQELSFNVDIVTFDNMSLFEQIQLVRSYKYIIVACGSVQVHVSFLKKTTIFIELCEPGFRYPNTAIYGNYFNINTFSICRPLLQNNIHYSKIKQNNNLLKHINNNKLPSIITNSNNDINREKDYYEGLLKLGGFFIHTEQNIDSLLYIDEVKTLINNYN